MIKEKAGEMTREIQQRIQAERWDFEGIRSGWGEFWEEVLGNGDG